MKRQTGEKKGSLLFRTGRKIYGCLLEIHCQKYIKYRKISQQFLLHLKGQRAEYKEVDKITFQTPVRSSYLDQASEIQKLVKTLVGPAELLLT